MEKLLTPLLLVLSLSGCSATQNMPQRVYIDMGTTIAQDSYTSYGQPDKTQQHIGVYYAIAPFRALQWLEFYGGGTHRSNAKIKGDNLKGAYIEGPTLGFQATLKRWGGF